MKKISIKREQSQAGLSFAEREKFRPQVKNKLLLLLALLLTAATGAWADGTYTIKFEANGNSKTVENVTLPHTFSCDYSGENGELDQIIKQLYGLSGGCCAINSLGASGNSNVTAGLNGQNQFITISAPFEGNATVTGMYFDANYSDFNYSLTISCPGYDPNAGGYSVTLKDGVKDADKWTVKVGEGQALALPVAVLSSTNINKNRVVVWLLRVLLMIIRTLPTLIIAKFASLIFGLGTYAGTMAIIVFTFGIVAKMMYESIETIDMGAFEATESFGANKFQSFWSACMPQILPTYLSYCLYSLEMNIRAAAILGYVGAGGLGILINEFIGWRDYESLGAVLLALFVVVLIIENTSQYLRKKLS